ncbi:hypothetical protein E3T61_03030 [Cryobacterium lactosi]|uniref:Uncharacterized protein n=1 Tax=Cryobacterium lactosi TaxID=1259202 RepID=A0A4R9BZJ9_9MICO|nr:hypothetical protein [Cryobacterium lactosi]TFD93988.1 hypothetical protein E3T61_03030 [Cryobacterium lactosi]
MRDDHCGPSLVTIASLRGYRYTAMTEDGVVTVRMYESGSITGGFQRQRGAMGPHLPTEGRIFPIQRFELSVGEPGWVEWTLQEHWRSEGFTTGLPILWIDAAPLPRMDHT